MAYAGSEKAKACVRRYEIAHREERKARLQTPEYKAQKHAYYLANRDKFIAKARENQKANAERNNAKAREYRENHKERLREYDRKRHEERKADPVRLEKHRVWFRAWLLEYRSDKTIRIINRLRARVRGALRHRRKCASTAELIGMKMEQFEKYIESLFTEGMSWELFMQGKIDLDHIKPLKLYDMSDPQQQREAFHWSNMQPLWSSDNYRKSDIWNGVSARALKNKIARQPVMELGMVQG